MRTLTALSNLDKELNDLIHSSVPIVVIRKTLHTVLSRFMSGDLNATDIYSWANQLEGRDEVQYETGFEGTIADIIFCLSSPEINGQLTNQMCFTLIKELHLLPDSSEPRE
jgi:hypothetical protein